ncbi:MAG: Vps62-related protein, partial [Chloroflexota bacterium]
TSFELNGQPYIFGLKTTFDQAWISRIRFNQDTGQIEVDDYEFAWNRDYVAIKSFEIDGQPYLWALKDCCSQYVNHCYEARPGELYISRIYEEDGVVKIEEVNQLEDMKIIRDETVRYDYPAVIMGDFNVHKSKYGYMDSVFSKAGANDAYITVHGSAAGGETIDGSQNNLYQQFNDEDTCPGMGQNCFDRIDYVYVKQLGSQVNLVPTEVTVIKDWKYDDPNIPGSIPDRDLSDHYPISVTLELREPPLELSFTGDFELKWNDVNSSGSYDAAFYRPILPDGYYALGDYGVNGNFGNYSYPTGGVYGVKDLEVGALSPPVSFVELWRDSGSSAAMDGSIWQPIPPPGYQCLGFVAQSGYAVPNRPDIRCVREDLAIPGKRTDTVWTSEGNGAAPFGAWLIVPVDDSGVYLGTFSASTAYTPPADPVYVLDARAVKRAVPSEALELTYSGQFEWKWDDRGSGGDVDGAFYKPVLPAGYYTLGDYAQGGQMMYAGAYGGVLVAQELIDGALEPPKYFSWVWDDSGSGAAVDGSFWQPVPEPGYVCLGLVAQYGHGYPTDRMADFRCVRWDLVAPATVGDWIYIDYGTGANNDFGAWTIRPTSQNGLGVGTFTGTRSHGKPTQPVYVLDARAVEEPVPTGVLEVAYATEYELVWNDMGSGGTFDGAFYKPMVPDGFYALGHYGTGHYETPTARMIVVRPLEEDALQPPIDYVEVWQDEDSGADMNGSFWQPVPAFGYVCLGLVAQPDWSKPPLEAIRCVREDLVAPGTLGNDIWIDYETGARYDFGAWPIYPADDRGLLVGTFAGHNKHQYQPDYPVFVLDRRSVRHLIYLPIVTVE